MAFACCWYGFRLCEAHWLENTVLDIGEGEMGCNYCLFGKNGDGGCGCQDWVNVNEKDSQDNTDIHRKNHEWRNEGIPGLRLLDKRLFLCLRGVLRYAIYNRLRLIL